MSRQEYHRNYRKINKEKLNKYNKEWMQKSRDNPDRKYIQKKTKASIYCVLYNYLKSKGSVLKIGDVMMYVGCSKEELIKHIESQFTDVMNWSNHAQYGWHIDHIIPLSSFDLSVEENIFRAMNYKNLRPLWWRENLSKNKSYPQE